MATLVLTSLAQSWGWSPFAVGLMGMAGGYIDRSIFSKDIEGAKMSDLKVQTSTYGVPIPVVYGTVRTSGNIIWATDFVEHEHEDDAGKGGGPKVKSYTYTVSIAIALCEGEIESVGRCWADGNEIDLEATFRDELPPFKQVIFEMVREGRDQTCSGVTIYKGTETQMPNAYMESILGFGNVPAYRGLAYIVIQDLNVSKFGNRIPQITFEVTRAKATVPEIIDEVSIKAGLAVNDYNAIPQPPRLIEISHNDLAAYESENRPSKLNSTRKQEDELPSNLNVNFLNKDDDYQQGSEPANRQATTSKEGKTITIPMVLTPAEAKKIAEIKLYEAWASRTSHAFSCANKYLNVAPGDIALLKFPDKIVQSQVIKSDYGKPGIVKCQGASFDQSIYGLPARILDPIPPKPEQVETGPVTLHILDIPLLRDNDNPAQPYVAATGAGWKGCAVYKSIDDGASYSLLTEILNKAVIGTAVTVLPAGPHDVFDDINTVDVDVSGTLLGVEKLAVLNGANAALIGNEIVQFQTAELIAKNRYRLSRLLRGRRGTEHQVSSHVIGERFILLNRGVVQLPLTTDELFLSRKYLYGPSTKPNTDTTYLATDYSHSGVAYLPYSPCHIKGYRNETGDITISWTRRTRTGGAWLGYSDVPLGEDAERYEVEIITDGSVKRTLSAENASVVYMAADQTSDFGYIQSSVVIKIYQLSAIRGRGIPGEAVI